jgi:hypothetical protein
VRHTYIVPSGFHGLWRLVIVYVELLVPSSSRGAEATSMSFRSGFVYVEPGINKLKRRRLVD